MSCDKCRCADCVRERTEQQQMVKDWWAEVLASLVGKFGLSSDEAHRRTEILKDRYHSGLSQCGMDLYLHDDPEYVAESLAKWPNAGPAASPAKRTWLDSVADAFEVAGSWVVWSFTQNTPLGCGGLVILAAMVMMFVSLSYK